MTINFNFTRSLAHLFWSIESKLTGWGASIHTYTISSWSQHTRFRLNSVQKSLNIYFQIAQSTTTCVFLFIRFSESRFFEWIERKKTAIWIKKLLAFVANSFQRGTHAAKGIIVHTPNLYAAEMITKAALNFMPTPTNHIDTYVPFKPPPNLIPQWCCFDHCNTSIFNQKLYGNNVNGMAVCHLSFRFQSFNLKTMNIFVHFST